MCCVVPLVALLGACNDGDSNGDEASSATLCSYITGGGTTTQLTATCATCQLLDAANAIDGDPDTYATITLPAGASGSVALRATAQDGVVYPAGNDAGVILSFSASGDTFVNNGNELRTYLDGAPAGTKSGAEVTGCCGGGSSRPQRVSFTAPAMFDAVEAGYTVGTNTTAKELRIHEFCGD